MASDQWVINLETRANSISPSMELERQKKQCISRVPHIFRDLNKNAYDPHLVSFGPYHHDRDSLRPMERYKHLALSNYLKRANTTVAQVAKAMEREVEDFMGCYDGLIKNWITNREGFLEMMILDGCFFLDLMIWRTVQFLKPYMTTRLWMDMLKLENQLPLNVLAVLIEEGGNKNEDTKKFIEYYYKQSTAAPSTDDQSESISIRGRGLHHLDIYRTSATDVGNYSYNFCWSVRSASELYQKGVHFERSKTVSLKDIDFADGKLRLPSFPVDHNTEPLLLNYIAYEQIHNVDNAVTSYAFLMDNLINTAKDVALLREKKIIQELVGSDDEIASLFNKLTNGLTFSKWWRSDTGVNKKLFDYCNRKWPKYRAILVQNHLSNPWVITSLLAGIILLLLTIAQTTYTIMPYYKKSG